MRDRCFIGSLGVRIVFATIALLVQTRFVHSQSICSVDDLIQGLGSPEALVREDSSARLQAMGQSARPALREATASLVPEVAARAWSLLGRIPFYLPADPVEVKACLFDYELDNLVGRAARIDRLSALATPEARDALLRIARDEPAIRLRYRAVVPLVLSLGILEQVRETLAAMTNHQTPMTDESRMTRAE